MLENAPHIRLAECDLHRQLLGLEGLHVQNLMARDILRVRPRHEPDLNKRRVRQQRLRRPPRELRVVVLHLRRQNRAALRVQLRLPALRPAGGLRAAARGSLGHLVERLHDHGGRGAVGVGRGADGRRAVDFAAREEDDVFGEFPLAVEVTDGGHFGGLVDEGVGFVEADALGLDEEVLGEAVVELGRLGVEGVLRVDVLGVVAGRVASRLVDGDKVDF
mmetsp:Transcript_12557/g.31727  ORF Transcript_12557/g.31727 Transcript_12557/m.31727 type:complete len:219 (-) Transcript_12557:341-997(-)